MATLDNGIYYVYNAYLASGTTDYQSLGTVNGALYDGTNLLAESILGYPQVWIVTSAPSSTKRIINKLSGKSMSLATETGGTPAKLLSCGDPAFTGQHFNIESVNSTVTYDGVTYDCYNIVPAGLSGYGLCPTIDTTGDVIKPIQLGTTLAERKAKWFFVPVPAFKDGDIYEIAPALNYNLRLDVTGAGQTDGTNVQLYAENGTNAQKWLVASESTGYSLQSVVSGRFLDVDGAQAANDTNVQTWTDNETNAQRWNLISQGAATIGGETVDIYRLGSYVTSNGSTYLLNVANAARTSNANVQIHTLTSTPEDCLFALIPSERLNASYPVPYNLAVTDEPLSEHTTRMIEQGSRVCLTWQCAPSWMSAGPCHYEIRTRTRTMRPNSSSWGAWDDWSAWETADVTISGNRVWYNRDYSIQYDWSMNKSLQLQFQVRAASAETIDGKTQVVVGQAATEVIDIYRLPVITWSDANWTPDGFKLNWTSDYNLGATELYLRTLDLVTPLGPVTGLLKSNRYIRAPYYQTSETIPFDQVQTWPDDDGEVKLYYEYGTDVIGPIAQAPIQTLTVAYDAGTVDVTPTTEWVQGGYRMVAFAPDLGETRMWVRTSKRLFECPEKYLVSCDPGYKEFEILFPMGEAFEIYTWAKNSTGSQWGTSKKNMAAINKFFHAFTWIDDDGIERNAFLDAWTSGDQPFQVSKNAVYQADILDDRPYESISSTNAVKTRLTISGVLLRDAGTDVEYVRFMVNHHARWRSPINGNYADLYISDVTLTEQKNRTEISISAIKETL